MPLLSIPNELLLVIARYLSPQHLSHFIQSNRHLAILLTPLLHKFAIQECEGLPALHWAARRGSEPLIRLLLTNGADINGTSGTRENATALHYAARNGHESAMKLLVENGAYIHAKDLNHHTPLVWATGSRSEVGTRTMLNHGGDPNDPGWNETPVLIWAANGDLPIVKLLVERGADVNIQAPAGRWTALFAAVLQPDTKIAQLLLDSGADPNISISGGATALHHVARHGESRLVGFMVERGVNLNVQDIDGNTPLHYAMRRNMKEGIKALLRGGADDTIKNNDGKTACDCKYEWGMGCEHCGMEEGEGEDVWVRV